MKSIHRLLLLPALVLALFTPAIADTIEVRADSWPPYSDDPASPQPGYIVELLTLIFPQDKINAQICPWPRAVNDVLENKIHAIIGATKYEAPGALYPEEPAGATNSAFFVTKDDPWRFTNVESLKTVKLGAVSGYSYDSGPIDAYLASATMPAVQLVAGDDPLQTNIKKIQAGRITALLEDVNVMNWTLKKSALPATTFTNAGLAAAEPIFIYVTFSPKHPQSAARAAQWTEGIRKLRADGTLAKILAKYDVKDWKK